MVYPSKLSLDRIADAAVDLVMTDGVGALAMRAVAQRLGVQASSLYKHVGDLAGLQGLAAERAAHQLHTRLTAASAGTPHDADPSHALRLAAHAYADFARAQPALYALLLTDTSRSETSASIPNTARKALWEALLALVAPLSGDADDTGAAVVIWAFLHGFVALERAGLFGASGPHDGLRRGIDALATGLGTTRRTSPRP